MFSTWRMYLVCTVYIFSSDFDGLLRLQRIFKTIPIAESKGHNQFQVAWVKQISSADEAIEFLLELERKDRNSLKRVILDCPANMAKVSIYFEAATK